MGVVMLSYFLGGPPFVSRSWLVVAWLGSMAGLMGSRLLWRRTSSANSRGASGCRRVLIAGGNQHGHSGGPPITDPRHGTEVVGFLDDYQRPGTEIADGLAVVDHPLPPRNGRPARRRADHHHRRGAELGKPTSSGELVTRPDRRVEAWVSPTFYDLLTTSTEMTHVGHVPLLYLYPTRFRGGGAALKGFIDWAVAS